MISNSSVICTVRRSTFRRVSSFAYALAPFLVYTVGEPNRKLSEGVNDVKPWHHAVADRTVVIWDGDPYIGSSCADRSRKQSRAEKRDRRGEQDGASNISHAIPNVAFCQSDRDRCAAT